MGAHRCPDAYGAHNSKDGVVREGGDGGSEDTHTRVRSLLETRVRYRAAIEAAIFRADRRFAWCSPSAGSLADT